MVVSGATIGIDPRLPESIVTAGKSFVDVLIKLNQYVPGVPGLMILPILTVTCEPAGTASLMITETCQSDAVDT